VADIETINNVYVDQATTGQYAIHEFKNFAGSAISVSLKWQGKVDYNLPAIVLSTDYWNFATGISPSTSPSISPSTSISNSPSASPSPSPSSAPLVILIKKSSTESKNFIAGKIKINETTYKNIIGIQVKVDEIAPKIIM
jgi:hypothetical protein